MQSWPILLWLEDTTLQRQLSREKMFWFSFSGLGLHIVSSRVKFINEANRSSVPLLPWEKVYPSYTGLFIHPSTYVCIFCMDSCIHAYDTNTSWWLRRRELWMLRVRAGVWERVAAVTLEIIFLTPHRLLTPSHVSARFIAHMIFMQTWIISILIWIFTGTTGGFKTLNFQAALNDKCHRSGLGIVMRNTITAFIWHQGALRLCQGAKWVLCTCMPFLCMIHIWRKEDILKTDSIAWSRIILCIKFCMSAWVFVWVLQFPPTPQKHPSI